MEDAHGKGEHSPTASDPIDPKPISMGDTYDNKAIRAWQAEEAKTDNPGWTAVDKFAAEHLDVDYASLSSIRADSDAADLPPIESNIQQAKLLAMQVYAGNITHVLEVGTLGGLTAAWIAKLNPQVKVVTIEANASHAAVAAANLAKAGVADQVEIIHGTGVAVLTQLLADVQGGARPKFGFAFIDADKPNNYTYLDLIVRMSHLRSAIYIDNCIPWNIGSTETDKDELATQLSRSAQVTIEKTGKDPRVHAVVQQTVGAKGWNGFLMAVVK